MTTFKRLVAYGCSLTAGDELSDHLCLGIDFETCNDLKRKQGTPDKWEQSRHEGRRVIEYLRRNDFREKNKELSYVGKLANLLGIECVNNAKPGNAIAHMYYEFVRDFLDDKIKKDDLVLIGCTLIPRYLSMQYKLNKFQAEGRPITCDFKHSANELDALLKIYTDEKLVWEFYNWLAMFVFFAQQNNIKLVMVAPTPSDIDPNHPEFQFGDVDHSVIKFAHKVWDDISTKAMITDKGLENFFIDPENENWAGFLHFPEHNHQGLAEHLHSKLKVF